MPKKHNQNLWKTCYFLKEIQEGNQVNQKFLAKSEALAQGFGK